MRKLMFFRRTYRYAREQKGNDTLRCQIQTNDSTVLHKVGCRRGQTLRLDRENQRSSYSLTQGHETPNLFDLPVLLRFRGLELRDHPLRYRLARAAVFRCPSNLQGRKERLQKMERKRMSASAYVCGSCCMSLPRSLSPHQEPLISSSN